MTKGCFFVKETVTVKQNYEFRRLYAKGKSAVGARLVIYCRKNRCGQNRLGVTVSAKLGKAVIRNRIKRQLREIFRLAQPDMKQGYDVIIVARSAALGERTQVLNRQFYGLCRKLNLLKETEQ